MSTFRATIAGRTLMWDLSIAVSGGGVPAGEAGTVSVQGSTLTWSAGPLRVGTLRMSVLDPTGTLRDQLYTSGASATVQIETTGGTQYWRGQFVPGAGRQSSRYDETQVPVVDVSFVDVAQPVEDADCLAAPATAIALITDLTDALGGANVAAGIGWLPGDLAPPSGQDAPHLGATRYRGDLLARGGEQRSRGDALRDLLRLYSAEMWRSTQIESELDVGTWYVWQRHLMGTTLAEATRASQRYDGVLSALSEDVALTLPTLDLDTLPRRSESDPLPRWPSLLLPRVGDERDVVGETTAPSTDTSFEIQVDVCIPVGSTVEVEGVESTISRTVRGVGGVGPYTLSLGEALGQAVIQGAEVLARAPWDLVRGGLFGAGDVDAWLGSWTRSTAGPLIGDGCALLSTGGSYIQQVLSYVSQQDERVYVGVRGAAQIAGSAVVDLPVQLTLTADDGTLYYRSPLAWTTTPTTLDVPVLAGGWSWWTLAYGPPLPQPGLLTLRVEQAGASTKLDGLAVYLHAVTDEGAQSTGAVPVVREQGGPGLAPDDLDELPHVEGSVAGVARCESARPSEGWQPVVSWALEEETLNERYDLGALAAQQLLAERAYDDEALRLDILALVEPGTALLLGGVTWIAHADEEIAWDLVDERTTLTVVPRVQAFGGA